MYKTIYLYEETSMEGAEDSFIMASPPSGRVARRFLDFVVWINGGLRILFSE